MDLWWAMGMICIRGAVLVGTGLYILLGLTVTVTVQHCHFLYLVQICRSDSQDDLVLPEDKTVT